MWTPIITQKVEIFDFELECKLYQLSGVEFDGEFNGGSFEAHKPCLNPIAIKS